VREYVIRRIVLIFPTLFAVTVIVFLMVRLIPGDVVELMAMQHMREQSGSTQEAPLDADALREMLGLDKPWYTQYIEWAGGILTRFDFGKSLWTQKPVIEEIVRRLPWTFELGIFSFIIAQIIALPVGIYSAIRQDSVGDYLGRSFAIISLATPAFWLATMIMVFPSIWWGWSPPMQLTPFTENPGKNLIQFLIPALLVGTAMSATTMRMLRTTMLDVLRQDYVRTAWSKGLRERVIIVRHALRNAMMPVITIISGQVGIMWGGVVIMEEIFNIPGMGRLFVDAVFRRDYPYISALNVLFAGMGLFLILLCDLSYAWLDPRLRAKAFK